MTTNTSVSKHQKDAYDDIRNSPQKEVQYTDYSYFNCWFGRSDHIAHLIYFDCIYTTPVVYCDPLKPESEFLCPVSKGDQWSGAKDQEQAEWLESVVLS